MPAARASSAIELEGECRQLKTIIHCLSNALGLRKVSAAGAAFEYVCTRLNKRDDDDDEDGGARLLWSLHDDTRQVILLRLRSL